MNVLSNRTHTIFAALSISLLLLLGGCATNPVTGKNELSFISEAWELDIGKQQYSPSRQSQGGDYLADKRVQVYINEVGQKLAAVSDRQLPYEFKVVDSPVVNAFAVPGGFVYFTRGILAHFSNEAEFAGVLGHEIGLKLT